MRNILGGIKQTASPLDYLMLWLGLVGSAVGLSLPKEMVWKGQGDSQVASDDENLNYINSIVM